MSAYYVLGPCEAFSNLARFDSVRYGYCAEGHKDLGGQYEDKPRHRLRPRGAPPHHWLGSYLLSAGVYEKYYYPAQQVRTLITQDYVRAYEKVDVILAPVSPRTAFKFGEISDPTTMYLSDMFTISINIAGNGGMNMPVGWAPSRACRGRPAHLPAVQGREHAARGGRARDGLRAGSGGSGVLPGKVGERRL